MLLKDKNAIVYGAAGAVGSAVARAFAREGARVHLTGRRLGALDALAKDIDASGGSARTAEVDALDGRAVAEHLDAVAGEAGTIDVSFNAIGIPQHHMQGTPLTELEAEHFSTPIETYTRSHFLTGREAARRMIAQRSGVILMHTPTPSALGIPLMGGMSPAWAAMESLNRQFSAEWAQHGVRAVCLRTTGIEGTGTIDVVFGLHAAAYGISADEFAAMMSDRTHRKRATTLEELAEAAAFLASDRAAAITGTVANLTGGFIVD
jgi:NAD(P)-dependent dehydrogenase (short-subunit alcohol dehydrogenase family)